ncbi:MAG: hypothetical protein KAU31_02200, partial [Spirochaetaceae bacterium]|nr:hypothetical protein [Spirochaetaceae bacterium]
MIHGYRIVGADDLYLAPYQPAAVLLPPPEYYDKHETQAKESWEAFVAYFYDQLDDLSNKLPGSRELVLYEFRWDTDEGIKAAAEALAEEFSPTGAFGNRPLLLIGHSAGGVVARATAELHPESVGDQLAGMITLGSPLLGARYIGVLFDKTSDELMTNSTLIKTLNQAPAYNDKLIAYGGWFSILADGGHNPWCRAGQLLLPIIERNDGVVELHSAVVQGGTPQTIRKAVILDDYDHEQMRDDKDDGKYTLYKGIRAHLQELVEELGEGINETPIATILSPPDGAVYLKGEAISFEGHAEDQEDGPLTGTSLFWSLREDVAEEVIGTGESFTRHDLPVGTHIVVLNAVDSLIARGEAAVTISITEKTVLSAPQPTSPGSTSQYGPTLTVLTPTLQWNAVSNADSYAVAISEYPFGSANIVYNPQTVYGTSEVVPSGKLQYGK